MNNLYSKDKDIVIIRRTSGNKEFEEYPLIVQPSTVLAFDPANDLTCYPICALLNNATSASWALTASFTLFAGATLYALTAGTSSWANTAITAINASSSSVSSTSLLAITASNANTASVALVALSGFQFFTTQLTASVVTASTAIFTQLTASNVLISNLSIQSSSFAATASYVKGSNVDGVVGTASLSNGVPIFLPTYVGQINIVGHIDGDTTIYETSTVTVDNLGNIYGHLSGTASNASFARSASIAALANTASYVATASYYPPQQFLPSASYASASTSASYAKNASTASLALTASVWSAYVVPTLVTSSLTSSYSFQAVTSSYAITSSATITALGIIRFPTLAPGGVRVLGHTDGDGTIYESSVLVDGVGFIYGNLTGSAQNAQTATSASHANLADSASYYPPSAPSISSSYALLALTSSYAVTASYSLNGLPDITDNTSSHYIGINQTVPQYTLDLGGSPTMGASAGALTITTQNGSVGNGIAITADDFNGSPGNDGGHITLNAGNGVASGVFGGDIILMPGAAVNVRGGGVGILTNNPQFALDVSGSINFTGSLLQNGLPYTTSFAYTASYTLAVGSSSFATTASYVLNANFALSATSASYSPFADFATISSASISASYSPFADASTSSSYSPVADFATSASYALSSSNAVSASYSPVADFATSASAAINVPQIIPDSLGNGGTCLILNAADNGTPMYLHISSSGTIQVTTWA